VAASAAADCVEQCDTWSDGCFFANLLQGELDPSCGLTCDDVRALEECSGAAAPECVAWWLGIADAVNFPSECLQEWFHCAGEAEACVPNRTVEVRHREDGVVSTSWVADAPFVCDHSVFGMATGGSCEIRPVADGCGAAVDSLFPDGGIFPAECCSIFEAASALLECRELPCAKCIGGCETVAAGLCKPGSVQGPCYPALNSSALEPVLEDLCANASVSLIVALPDSGGAILPEGMVMLVFDEPVQQGTGKIGFFSPGHLVVGEPTIRGPTVFVPIPPTLTGDVEVLVDETAFVGVSGKPYWGFPEEFVLHVQGPSAPQVERIWPPYKATEVSVTSPVVVTFDRGIRPRPGAGAFFELREYSGENLLSTILLSSTNVFRIEQACQCKLVVSLPGLQYGRVYGLSVVSDAFEALDGSALKTIGKYEISTPAAAPQWQEEPERAEEPGGFSWLILMAVCSASCACCGICCVVFRRSSAGPEEDDLEAGGDEAWADQRTESPSWWTSTSSQPASKPGPAPPTKRAQPRPQKQHLHFGRLPKTPVHALKALPPSGVDPVVEVEQQLRALKAQPMQARRKKFKALLLKWHPDKNAHNSDQATRVFQVINDKRPWLLEGD